MIARKDLRHYTNFHGYSLLATTYRSSKGTVWSNLIMNRPSTVCVREACLRYHSLNKAPEQSTGEGFGCQTRKQKNRTLPSTSMNLYIAVYTIGKCGKRRRTDDLNRSSLDKRDVHCPRSPPLHLLLIPVCFWGW